MRPLGWYLIVGSFSLMIGIGSVIVISKKNNKVELPIATNQVIAEEPKVEQTFVNSGDGTMKVVGNIKNLNNGETEYQFITVNNQTNSENNLYESILDQNRQIVIPFNSWSPDNKQLFLQETGPEGTDYFVFKGDSSAYNNGQQYLDINAYWEKAKMKLQIDQVTGWASNDLLVVNTRKDDGTEGPSYWFVISSRSFMQLRQL